jgi:hypothetical protein
MTPDPLCALCPLPTAPVAFDGGYWFCAPCWERYRSTPLSSSEHIPTDFANCVSLPIKAAP